MKVTGILRPRLSYACTHCGGELESPLEDCGKDDSCPLCQAPFQVPTLRATGVRMLAACKSCNRPSFWLWLLKKEQCSPCRHRSDRLELENRARQEQLRVEFADELVGHALNGGLTESNLLQVEGGYRRQGLREFTRARVLVYKMVFSRFANDRDITESEKATLTKLRSILDLHPSDLGDLDEELARLEYLSRLRRGDLTSINVPLVLQKQEEAFIWLNSVEFHQERVVRKGYVGGSQGASIRICKGVTYRVGAHRGRLVSDREVVLIDRGSLCLTSKRLIFSGPSKSFSIPLGKILNVTPFGDGISVTRDSAAESNKPLYFKTADTEIVCLALSQLLMSA